MRRLATAFLSLFVAISALAQQQYELVLIPVGAYNVPGAFGSLWQTELTGFNEGESFVPVKSDLIAICVIPEGCPDPAKPHQVFVWFVGDPQGQFIYVGRDHADDVQFHLRVFDSAHPNLSFGTMLPIARERDFSATPVYFFDVVVDPRSRTLLRIYGFDNVSDDVTVNVTRTSEPRVGRAVSVRMPLHEKTHSNGTAFPSFGSIDLASVLPPDILVPGVGPPRFLVQVQPNAQKLWGSVTITNNETQHVTAIAP